ncbi:uncharacterized protein LOC131887633 [Tigriopus californicus]|uniref:uncharacterized protein LOC131887633 n=1 Tax=Tigriopus californicus TaxID=6832 RepID=UPI0027DA000B|nr:uncharacterized protein LOC131887633 [Tigriopus californicus]
MFITKALIKIVFKLISNNYSDNDGGNDQDDDCDGPHANAPRVGNRDGPLVAKNESTRNYHDGPADDDYDDYDPKESDPHGNGNDDTPDDNHRDSDIQEGDDDNDDELPLEGDGEDDSREDDCNDKYEDNPLGVMNDQQVTSHTTKEVTNYTSTIILMGVLKKIKGFQNDEDTSPYDLNPQPAHPRHLPPMNPHDGLGSRSCAAE